MTNKNKRIGSTFESAMRELLRDHNHDVEHLRLSGAADEGDLYIRDWDLVCELKNEKRINLSGYTKEAKVEAENFAKARRRGKDVPVSVSFIKARQKGLDQTYVVFTYAEFARLMRRRGL